MYFVKWYDRILATLVQFDTFDFHRQFKLKLVKIKNMLHFYQSQKLA